MKERMGWEVTSQGPHTFIPNSPRNVLPTNLELDPIRPVTVFEDPVSGEKYAEIAEKNRLGQNNYPLGQAVISMCCKGVLNVSEALPVTTPDGKTIIASRIIDLEKTEVSSAVFSKNVDAERWILRYIFGDTDHPINSDNNLRTTPNGQFAWFDFAQGADNFFFLGSVIDQGNISHTQEDGIAFIVLRKIQLLETHISDPRFIASIFTHITKNFPDKKVQDMFYEGENKTPADFQKQLLSRVRSAIQQLQLLPEVY